MAIFTGISNTGVTNPILGETSYPVTYNGTIATGAFTSFAATITLSAVTSFGAPLSGVAGQFAGTLNFTAAPNSTGTGLSASTFGVLLTIPSNIGPVGHYGAITNSTYVLPISTVDPLSATPAAGTFTLQFGSGNFLNTIVNLSANSTKVVYTPSVINQIDNPLFATGSIDNGTASGLSAYNMFFRTQGKHSRLVQSLGF